MVEGIDTKGIPHKKLRPIIEKVRAKIRENEIVLRTFKEHGMDIDELDLIPICFAKMDVSARTDHGVIYLNIKLLADGDLDNDDHYFVHELTHYCQQTTGDKATPGSDEGDYLDNPAEKEGFQNQVEHLADKYDGDTAEQYVKQVLDHHEQKGKKRKRHHEEMMQNVEDDAISKEASNMDDRILQLYSLLSGD